MKNTGQLSQSIFEAAWAKLGKRAVVHRFVDAAEIAGRAKIAGSARSAPADFIVTADGLTEFAEVKSSGELISFAFGMIRKSQLSFATRITAAGGSYTVYVHALALSGRPWFRVPWPVIAAVKASGKQSIRWSDLNKWELA